MKNGVKGNYKSNDASRELSREKKTNKEYSSSAREDDTQESTVKKSPWATSMKRNLDKAPVPDGTSRLASDTRKDCLIDGSEPVLDHHMNRADEHGGIKGGQDVQGMGNVSYGKKGKGYTGYMNPDESVR